MKIKREITYYNDSWEVILPIKDFNTPYTKGDPFYQFGIIINRWNTAICWDNLPAFIDMKGIKKECKLELKQNKCFKKGILEELQELINEIVKDGYL